jgi:hypothetical protein
MRLIHHAGAHLHQAMLPALQSRPSLYFRAAGPTNPRLDGLIVSRAFGRYSKNTCNLFLPAP